MARQQAALIGFCGVKTRKQIKKIWKQIEKARDATDVRTIFFTLIKEDTKGQGGETACLPYS